MTYFLSWMRLGPEVIKLGPEVINFLHSMKFVLVINFKIQTIIGILEFITRTNGSRYRGSYMSAHVLL